MQQKDLEPYLAPTSFVDFDHPDVQAWALSTCEGCNTPQERAIKLFYEVRDGIFYNPYHIQMNTESLKASATLAKGRAFCVPKAVLFVAGARAVGIPARLCFADVRNHLSTERLLQLMKTDVFAFHGYAECWLGERWVKASPTFNEGLCALLDVSPLDFDGVQDALLQPFDNTGAQHMEYLQHHGSFADLPYKAMWQSWREHYPHFFDGDRLLPVKGVMEKQIFVEAAPSH